MEQHVYIGRQPVVDKDQKIIGYELLFRHSKDATTAQFTDDLTAGLQVLVNALNNMGANWLFGDKIAFINVSAPILESEYLELLPANRVVLEIVENTVPTPELITRCKNLKAEGFNFALDDFLLTPESAPWLDIASYVKLDVQAIPQDQLAGQVAALAKYPVKLIAEKVETRAEFQICQKLNFAYFQGYHFAHPETLSAKVINPAHATVLDLLNKVRNNADIKEIETGFKRDVALSFKLLRYINSVGFGLSCEIQSIRHALTILGYSQLYRWLTLLVATAGDGSTPPALMKNAITRGRLTELLGEGFLGKSDRDNLFIVGIFSMLDAMLEMPMDDILEKLFLPETIGEALLTRQGIYGPFLALAEACEGDDIKQIEELSLPLGIEPDKVNQSHLSALAWVEALGV